MKIQMVTTKRFGRLSQLIFKEKQLLNLLAELQASQSSFVLQKLDDKNI